MGLFKKIKKAGKSLLKKAAPVIGGAIGSAFGPVGASVGAKLGGALASSSGAKKSANALVRGNQAAAQEQRNALVTANQYQQPYADVGAPALDALDRVNSGDYSAFNTSPDYLYARDQALEGVQNSAAARGGLFSGNTGIRLAETAGGLASQNLGNYRNSLMNQIGIGQSAANNMGNATLSTASNVGNALVGAGDAKATGIADSTNIWGNALGSVAGDLTNYLATRKKKPAGTPKISLVGPY